jgi:hypothetical protein
MVWEALGMDKWKWERVGTQPLNTIIWVQDEIGMVDLGVWDGKEWNCDSGNLQHEPRHWRAISIANPTLPLSERSVPDRPKYVAQPDEIQHTSGPWKYDHMGAIVMTEDSQMSITDIRGFGVLDVRHGTSLAIKIMDANGILITASPDLFESLLDAIYLLRRLGFDLNGTKIGKMVAAIEKATGKTVEHFIGAP